MKSLIAPFKNLTMGKKLALLASPALTLLISMKLVILGLFLLIIIDLLTGIRKNFHLNNVSFGLFKKEFWMSIKSYLLRKTWVKTYEYVIGIVAIAVLESMIFGGMPITIFSKVFSLTELAIVIPALVETWSIWENLEAVSGHNPLKKLLPLMPKAIQLLFQKSK